MVKRSTFPSNFSFLTQKIIAKKENYKISKANLMQNFPAGCYLSKLRSISLNRQLRFSGFVVTMVVAFTDMYAVLLPRNKHDNTGLILTIVKDLSLGLPFRFYFGALFDFNFYQSRCN